MSCSLGLFLIMLSENKQYVFWNHGNSQRHGPKFFVACPIKHFCPEYGVTLPKSMGTFATLCRAYVPKPSGKNARSFGQTWARSWATRKNPCCDSKEASLQLERSIGVTRKKHR